MASPAFPIPQRPLDELVRDLRRSRALITPQELTHRLPPTVPTGLAELDRLLGGGLPQGRIVEIGEAQGGLGTGLALGILSSLTREGRLAAWVDRMDAFDPRGAAEAGADLERILWCRPTSTKDALRAADVLLASGAFSLVVLDLGPSPAAKPRGRASATVHPLRGPRQAGVHLERYDERPRQPRKRDDGDRIGEGAWLRLSRDAEAARASLLVLGGGGAGAFAAATLRPVRSAARFFGMGPGRTFEGLSLSVALERNKLGLPPGEAALSFRAPELFPTEIRDPAPGCARVGTAPALRREGR